MLDAYDVNYTLEKVAIDRPNERSSRVKKFLASAKSEVKKKKKERKKKEGRERERKGKGSMASLREERCTPVTNN